MEVQQKQNSGKRQHKCPDCPYIAPWVSQLIDHRRVHTGERPFPCKHCAYQSAQKSGLKQHVLAVHEGEKCGNVCHHAGCEYRASTPSQLRIHVNRVHEKIAIKCPKTGCDLKSLFSVSVRTHVRAVHEGKRYVCPYDDCDYSSSYKSSISRHRQQVHLHVRNYFCHLCDYSSYEKSHLKTHMRTHSKDGHHANDCKDCDVRFQADGRLTRYAVRNEEPESRQEKSLSEELADFHLQLMLL